VIGEGLCRIVALATGTIFLAFATDANYGAGRKAGMGEGCKQRLRFMLAASSGFLHKTRHLKRAVFPTVGLVE